MSANYVAELNQLAQRRRWEVKYEEVSFAGPDHIKTFIQRAVLNGQPYRCGVGKKKKAAKQMAAKNALEGLLDFSSESSKKIKVAPPNVTTEHYGFADINFVGIVNHHCQKKGLIIDYVAVKKTGPFHNPRFFYKVVINKKDYPLGKGKNIKEAKQKAAELAWSGLQDQPDWDRKVSIRPSEDFPGRVHITPFLKIAANACKSKENIVPNLANNDKPAEKTSPQPVNSRFLSEYDSIEHLGEGGYGSVFKAKQKLIEKYFAIKIICFKKKALREVRALSDLCHENIVRYFTCWMEDTGYQWDPSADSHSSSQSTCSSSPVKFLYIQMELCDTKNLRVWIDDKNVKKSRHDARRQEESLMIAQQLIAGVEYIHSKSLIHRDLKPANIMFGCDKKMKIGDFGLVTNESNDKENQKQIARTVDRGTPTYMAPEQRNSRIYDRKVDIYALGLIYFELLWNIATTQERQAIWNKLRVQKFPDDFEVHFPHEGLIIKSMLSELPPDRPEASEVKLKLHSEVKLKLQLAHDQNPHVYTPN